MLKQLTVLMLVCSVPVSTLKKNALEHEDLQTIAEKQLHGTFQPFNRLFLLLAVPIRRAASGCSPLSL